MKKKQAMIWLIPLCILLFIFNNSATPAVASDEASYSFVYMFENIFLFFKPTMTIQQMNHIIRKLAHFTEYFGLAFSIYIAHVIYPIFKNKYLLATSFIIPILDEWIQYFTPGRNCNMKDVLLDSFGMLCAFIFCILIHQYIKKHHSSL